MEALTDASVRKHKPTDKRREIRDAHAPGLYLVIQPSGVKSWAVRFRRPDGRPGKLTLGPVDLDKSKEEAAGEPVVGAPLRLSAARQLAVQVARQRRTGADPIAERRRKKAESGSTFGAVARDFIREHRTKRGALPRGWRRAARVLGLDYPLYSDPTKAEPTEMAGGLAQRWAAKPIDAITSHDVHALVDEARRKGLPGVAPTRNLDTSESRGRLVFSVVSMMFRWAVRRRRVAASPCAGVWAPGPGAPRERVLSAGEVRDLWRACGEIGYPYGPAVKLLLLTGCRLAEIGELRWEEVDDSGAELHLPGNRVKNHRPHTVFLAPAARAILADVPRIEGCPFVFSSTGRKPLNGWSNAKDRLEQAMKPRSPWRVHDLRRTAVTGMVELGVPPHVVELMVNHVGGARGGVAGVYNRSEMRAERRAAADRWAAHVAGIVSGSADNVVALRS
jgi:integrase